MAIDIFVFVTFIAAVMTLALWKSRTDRTKGEKDAQDYFLAGRGLSWWLIGFSLIAANISTEQFVGMSGNAASHVGLAIASYEWMAAITLVIVAFAFLPYFLRIGIYTVPEFLEYRYNHWARGLMATATVLIYMLLLAAVTYSGALTMRTLFGEMGFEVGLYTGSFFIALIAMIYVVTGGLKASVWADLIQGSALIIGGAMIMYFAFVHLGAADQAATVVDVSTGEVAIKNLAADQGAVARFLELNRNRLNIFLLLGAEPVHHPANARIVFSG
jgi:SSS family solute:Na+ symporter